jgi:hypothetical protein
MAEPRKRKKKEALNTPAERQALLDKPIADIASHHAAARELLSDDFVTGRESDGLDARVALSMLLKGQQEMTSAMQSELAHIRARMDAYDQAAEAWEKDRQRFMEEVISAADKIRPTGERLERAKAEAAQVYSDSIQQARAQRVNKQLQIEAELKTMEQELVVSPGVIEMRSVQGQPQPTLVPQVIRLFNHAAAGGADHGAPDCGPAPA